VSVAELPSQLGNIMSKLLNMGKESFFSLSNSVWFVEPFFKGITPSSAAATNVGKHYKLSHN
jgi:hypothetical protein